MARAQIFRGGMGPGPWDLDSFVDEGILGAKGRRGGLFCKITRNMPPEGQNGPQPLDLENKLDLA